MAIEVPVVKDQDNEGSIPTVWRPVFCEIVKSFVAQNYTVSSGTHEIAPVSNDTADHIKAYIESYGEKLIELSEDTWNSSVCIWMGNCWDVVIDLRTIAEGQSDMVLKAQVFQSADEFSYHIEMVYVP